MLREIDIMFGKNVSFVLRIGTANEIIAEVLKVVSTYARK